MSGHKHDVEEDCRDSAHPDHVELHKDDQWRRLEPASRRRTARPAGAGRQRFLQSERIVNAGFRWRAGAGIGRIEGMTSEPHRRAIGSLRAVALDAPVIDRLATFYEQLAGWRRIPDDDDDWITALPPVGQERVSGVLPVRRL